MSSKNQAIINALAKYTYVCFEKKYFNNLHTHKLGQVQGLLIAGVIYVVLFSSKAVENMCNYVKIILVRASCQAHQSAAILRSTDDLVIF